MLLQTNNLTKRFGGLVAVSDVDMEIHEGEVLGLIGPNGAGKTTLFNLLTGVYQADKGSIHFHGTDVTRQPAHRIARLGMARTFQNIKLFGSLTVAENVRVGLMPRSRLNAWNSVFRTAAFRAEDARLEARSRELLAMVGLEGRADDLAGDLPYGEQRYLEIVRALATEPKLLILDEPGAGMNDSESDHLVTYIRQIRDAGHTVLLIEHDMGVIMDVCDRIIVLNFGKKIAEGTPEEIRRHSKVIEAYLGEEEEGDA